MSKLLRVAILACETRWPKDRHANMWINQLNATKTLQEYGKASYQLYHVPSEEYPTEEDLNK